MKRISLAYGALLGGLTSLPLIALLYLGDQLAGLPFVPFDIFDWLARALPGGLVTFGIDAIVDLVGLLGLGQTDRTGKLIEMGMALALLVLGGAVLGGLLAWLLAQGTRRGWQAGLMAGLIAFLIVAVIELAFGLAGSPALALLWLALLFGAWGALLGWLLARTASAPAEPQTEPQAWPASRRSALGQIAGGSIALALAAWGVGRFAGPGEAQTGAGQPLADLSAGATPDPTNTPAPSPTAPPTPDPAGTPAEAATAAPLPEATAPPEPTATATQRERVAPAPGTRAEITANEDFYRIDINTRPPRVEGESWVLEVEGLFDSPRPLTLEDLMAFPAITQTITLSCISNRIGGDLIGTSQWTGVRLRELLDDLGLQDGAQELYIEAADGFFESVSMADLTDPRTLLVYGMNGETLPVDHGFPLRIYIPNRYGMKQPKWITRIEAIDEKGPGYWVERGWSAEARPRIISIIDTVATDAVTPEGTIPVGGIAWAGDRGIQQVEVQVDGGPWQEAILRTPPLSGLTWVQWRYDWSPISGPRTFRVRATDGTGALQIGEESDVRPDGATGYHAVTRTI